MACLKPIWSTKTETATCVRGRIERVLDWAKVHGLRKGDNPARWREHLENLLPKPSKAKPKRHHAAMPFADVPAFMAKLPERDGRARRALRLTILTAARTEGVTGSTWAEFDLDGMLWMVPASRMKEGREHVAPLVPAAAAILVGLPRSAPPLRSPKTRCSTCSRNQRLKASAFPSPCTASAQASVTGLPSKPTSLVTSRRWRLAIRSVTKRKRPIVEAH